MPNQDPLPFCDLPEAPPSAGPHDVSRLQWRAKATATADAYGKDVAHFETWCEAHNLTPLPAKPQTLVRYLADHEEAGIPTLRRRLFAIAHAHRMMDHPTPTTSPSVREAWAGLLARRNHHPDVTEALGVADIRRVVAGIDAGGEAAGDDPHERLAALRDRAMVLCTYSGACTRAELASARVGQLFPIEGGMVMIVRAGDRPARRATLFRGETGLDPVSSLERWLSVATIREGPVFRGVDRHGNVSGIALHPSSVNDILKRRFALAGLDITHYSAQALRVGAIGEAAARGAEMQAILDHAGIKREETVFPIVSRARREGVPAGKLLGL